MKKYCFILSILVASLFTSCKSELELMQEDNKYLIPLNIDGSIKQIQTKATAQGFVDKDAVGLFAVNYSENNTIAGVL